MTFNCIWLILGVATRFTQHIAVLINEGKDKQAVLLIDKFNKQFPLAAIDEDYHAGEKLIDELLKETSAQDVRGSAKPK